jgi:hypothetical protein
MSTSKSRSTALDAALGSIPSAFRKRIIQTYLDLKRRHSEREFDAAGLSSGKLCESLLRFLQQELKGSHTPFGQKIANFADECSNLTRLPATVGNDSLRLLIPRALIFVYTLRNKRGIGHVGGDIDANEIDSATMTRTGDWMICELIRIYHNLSLEDAQAIVDAISIRDLPSIWDVAGKKRVLLKGLNYPDQVLLLLYASSQSGVLIEDLFEWTEYSHLSGFKKNVLRVLHKQRLVEYDAESEIAYISPTGARRVEEEILKTNQ